MNRAERRRYCERQRIRIKRAWDSGKIHTKIAQRDRTLDNLLRAKLDRKGSPLFSVTLPDRSVIRVEWSRAGRTDQFDLVDSGVVTFTGSPGRAIKELIARTSCLKANNTKSCL